MADTEGGGGVHVEGLLFDENNLCRNLLQNCRPAVYKTFIIVLSPGL